MKFRDDDTGRIIEVPDDRIEEARAAGLVPAEGAGSGGLGEALRTAGEEALRVPLSGAAAVARGVLGDKGAEAGLVSETTGSAAPYSGREAAPSLFNDEAMARRAAHGTAATLGGIAPYVGLGALTGGVGGAAGLVTESAVAGAAQEAAESDIEGRTSLSATGALYNGLLNLGFAGLGLGLGKAYRVVTGRATKPLAEAGERVAQRRLPGALSAGGADLADPAVAARAREVVGQRIDSTMGQLDEALSASRPPVANNGQAQRTALTGLADSLREAQPELAARLESLATLPRERRFRGLLDLSSGNPNVAAALDQVRSDPALWGDKAVAHGQALAAARAARPSGPGAYLDAIRGVDDPAVKRLANDLAQHVDVAGSIEAAQAFAPGEARSAGAAAEDFADTDFDAAIKEIDEGKLKPAAVKAVAEVAPGKRALMAHDAADSLDTIDEILKQDVSFGVKRADFERGAAELSSEQIEAQRGWLSEQAARGRQIADELVESRARVESGEGYDTKGLGVDAINKIRTGLSRIEAAEDAAARNIETDLFKREVDGLVKRVGASRSLDEGTQHWLMGKLRPYADALRDGLQDSDLWGRNAELQRELNAGWHQLIDPYSRVQRELTELLGREYGEVGAAAINRRANVNAIERAMASNRGRGLYRDMSQALEGLDQIADARSQFGLSRLERLDEMRSAIRNVRDQFNTATVLRIAEKRAGVPAKLSTGELVTEGLGVLSPRIAHATHLAKVAGKVIRGLRPEEIDLTAALKGTATGRLFSRNLSRFARTQAEQLADTGFTREILSPTLRRALRGHGAPGMGGGGGASGAGGAFPGLSSVPQPLRQRVGTQGVRSVEQARELIAGPKRTNYAGSRPLDRVGPIGVSDAGIGRLDVEPSRLSGGANDVGIHAPGGEAQGLAQGGTLPPDIFTPHVGSVAEGGIFYERLSGPKGKTPGGMFRGTDGVIRYIKADKDPAHSAIEAGNAAMYRDLGRKVPDLRVVQLPGGHAALASEAFGPEWKELHQIHDWSALPASVRDSYAEGVPVDFIMGNWDVSRNARNIMTNGAETLMIDPGEAATNAWAAGWFKGNETQSALEIARTFDYGHGAGAIPDSVGTPPHELLRSYAESSGELRARMGQSFERAVATIEQAGGPEAFIRQHQPTLGPAEVSRAAAEMTDRIKAFRLSLPFFAGAIALAFSDPASAAEAKDMAAQLQAHEQEAQRDLDDTARALTDPDFAARWARQSRELPSTLESFQGLHRTLQQAYAERREAILRASQDPNYLIEHFSESFGDLPPEVGLKAFQIAQYLAAKLPPARGVTVTRPDGLPPSSLEMRRWALQYQAALDPSTVMDDAKRGRLRHEQVQVLKDMWGDRYDALRNATMIAMGDGKSSIVQRQRADLLFGFGSALDPAFSRRLAGVAQQAYAQRQQQGGAPGAPTTSRIAASTRPGGLNALQLGASAPLSQ